MRDYGLRQAYDLYSDESHKVWQILFDRQMEVLPGRASTAYFEGIKKTGFMRELIPNFDKVNVRLRQATNWGVIVVPGLIPNKPFFEYLQNRLFPATTWLRTMEQLDYLEEPDMFHDVFAHVPLLSDENFTNFLSELAKIALKHIDDEWAVEVISRLYWYTVEFGLINDKEEGGLRIYGAGILSSAGESVYSLESDVPKRHPFDVEHIMRTPYIKDRFQEQYWVIESYRQLFESIPEVERVLDVLLAEKHSQAS